jgi:hypothetical protein
VKLLDDPAYLAVGQDWVVAGNAEPRVEQGMPVEYARLRTRVRVGPAEAPRVCELKADE